MSKIILPHFLQLELLINEEFTDWHEFLFIRKDQFPVLLIDDNYRVFIDFFF